MRNRVTSAERRKGYQAEGFWAASTLPARVAQWRDSLDAGDGLHE